MATALHVRSLQATCNSIIENTDRQFCCTQLIISERLCCEWKRNGGFHNHVGFFMLSYYSSSRVMSNATFELREVRKNKSPSEKYITRRGNNYLYPIYIFFRKRGVSVIQRKGLRVGTQISCDCTRICSKLHVFSSTHYF